MHAVCSESRTGFPLGPEAVVGGHHLPGSRPLAPEVAAGLAAMGPPVTVAGALFDGGWNIAVDGRLEDDCVEAGLIWIDDVERVRVQNDFNDIPLIVPGGGAAFGDIRKWGSLRLGRIQKETFGIPGNLPGMLSYPEIYSHQKKGGGGTAGGRLPYFNR